MKESSRILTPSIANCIDPTYQYTLLQPYTYTYTVSDGSDLGSTTCTAGWPNEWNKSAGSCDRDIGNRTPQFTCNTVHEVGIATPILSSITEYETRSCFAGAISIDQKVVKTANQACIVSTPGSGDGDV